MSDYDTFAPLHIVGASGCYLHLADGSQLIDGISSWWCKALGHRHPHLTAAIKQQADAFEHVILANTTNEPIVRLCERLLAAVNGHPSAAWNSDAPPGRLPGQFGKVFLADNGSTGVEIALKMAMQAQAQRGQPQRKHFAALRYGYHGETIATLSVGDSDWADEPYQSLMFPVTMLDGLPHRTGPHDARWQDASAEWPGIETQLNAQADQLAAVIYEPIMQGANGMMLYSPDLLRRLRQWADANDVYLIADEIAAGMGRMGTMLASHLADAPDTPVASRSAMPDFTIVSKGLTGGYLPLAATLTTDEIYNLFLGEYGDGSAFMHSNTYTGNALAVAVANAALDVFADDGVLENVAKVGPLLHDGLVNLARTRPYLHNPRGCGMMAAIDICHDDGSPRDAKIRTGYQVYQAAIKHGALLRPLGDTMYLFPPLVMTEQETAKMLDILEVSLDEAVGG